MLNVIIGITAIIVIIILVAIFITWEDSIVFSDMEYNKMFHDRYETTPAAIKGNIVLAITENLTDTYNENMAKQYAELQTLAKEKPKPANSASVELAMIKQLYHKDLFNRIGDDKFKFYMTVLSATPLPQHLIYLALHQCYSSDAVKWSTKLGENDAGVIAVNRLLEGDRGHFSPIESATITISLEGFNHGTLQQLLRSRIGVSPCVQSFRYTKEHLLDAGVNKRDIEDVIYLRPLGKYHDREQSYVYDENSRLEDLKCATYMIKHVCKRLKEGMPAEQARGLLPFDYRQHAIITLNARSLMGILDRRSKKDAQAEIQILSTLLLEIFHRWMPDIETWYTKNRYSKARLAP